MEIQYVAIPKGEYTSKTCLARALGISPRGIRYAVSHGILKEIPVCIGENGDGLVRLIPKESAEAYIERRKKRGYPGRKACKP